MSDPAWFPSAAMQTIGAMYAIFAAVYVLALRQELTKKLPKRVNQSVFRAFLLISGLVGLCIFVNAMELYAHSAGSPPMLPVGHLGCLVFFLMAISFIILYSCGMVLLYFRLET